MVFIAPFVGAVVLLSGFVSAAPRPRPDSAIGEAAVSAPNGTPITDTAELASETAVAASSAAQATTTAASSGYGSSNYGSSGNYGSNQYSQADNSWVTTTAANSWTTTTAAWQSVSTAITAASSYSSPSYGSGNSNWGGSGYNDCVNQCIASYGAPMQSYQATATASQVGSSGSGATHTVIVAPTQGVLRYVPFAVNASVGDTIKFMWGANNHTVTKSSALTPCNKSSDPLFISGTQNKDFVFTQVVNDTNPTFFYCGTPTHCQKGMFGIINPPNALAAPTSVSGMMQSLSANSSDIAAMSAYSSSQTANNAAAAKWGGGIDMASLPDWSHSYVAENVMYTRNFLAANPDVLLGDGSIDLGQAGSAPLMIPQDLSAALNNAATSTSSSVAPAASTAAASQTPASTSSGNLSSSNGASSLASSKVVVALVAAIATMFLL